MATIREKRPGVWEVRVFTGADARGRPTQMSRAVRGGKRDAQKLAAQLEASAGDAKPDGRLVADVLDEWVKRNVDSWAPSSVAISMWVRIGVFSTGIVAGVCGHDLACRAGLAGDTARRR